MRSYVNALLRIKFWIITALLMKFLPLVGYLHVEACIVLAFFAHFAGGFSVLKSGDLKAVILQQFAGLSVAAFILLLPFPCPDIPISILLFVTYPLISSLFGIMLGKRIYESKIKRKRSLFILISILLLTLPVIFDLGFHPQMYHYNHIFGGVLNPIYDEELALRIGFFAFRILTILWILLLFYSLNLSQKYHKIGFGITATLLLIAYLNLGNLGIVTTYQQIEKGLGTKISTPHFDIWYDASQTKPKVAKRWAYEHEKAYESIKNKVRFSVDKKIQSYIYPSAAIKAEITGARWTNVSPVWLEVPQIHLLNETQSSMQHELAHVFSRKFGLPLLKASWYIGLVEGFAVSLEQEKGLPKPNEQLAIFTAEKDFIKLKSNLKAGLSPQGFWSGRGAVSYTQTGAFVSFLIDKYGIEKIKKVYAKGDFEVVYQKTLDKLLEEWILALKSTKKRLKQENPKWLTAAKQFTKTRFSAPSLFEQNCPHCIDIQQQKLEKAWQYIQPFHPNPDTTKAIQLLKDNPLGATLLAQLYIHKKEFRKAKTTIATLFAAQKDEALADVAYFEGRKTVALQLYKRLLPQIPYFARRTKANIHRRIYTLSNNLPFEKIPQTTFLRYEKALESGNLATSKQIAKEAFLLAQDDLLKRFWSEKR